MSKKKYDTKDTATVMYGGVKYRIPRWLEVNQSIFLPSLEYEELAKEVKKYYFLAGYETKVVKMPKDGIMGFRVWRIA